MDQRPPLDKSISVKDFRDFYWLKAEMVQFCREVGLPTGGGKLEIADRIERYLQTGIIEKKTRVILKSTSTFDWNDAPLSRDTLITDNYKNSENVRTFFEAEIGGRFKFNVKFMNWMKANVGKTLADAIEQWHVIQAEKKSGQRKEIDPQFEYNRYIRDFLEDNPGLTRGDAIKYWNIRRRMRGDKRYRPEDLELPIDSAGRPPLSGSD